MEGWRVGERDEKGTNVPAPRVTPLRPLLHTLTSLSLSFAPLLHFSPLGISPLLRRVRDAKRRNVCARERDGERRRECAGRGGHPDTGGGFGTTRWISRVSLPREMRGAAPVPEPTTQTPDTGVLLLLSHLVDSLAFVPVMVGTLQFFFEVSQPTPPSLPMSLSLDLPSHTPQHPSLYVTLEICHPRHPNPPLYVSLSGSLCSACQSCSENQVPALYFSYVVFRPNIRNETLRVRFCHGRHVPVLR